MLRGPAFLGRPRTSTARLSGTARPGSPRFGGSWGCGGGRSWPLQTAPLRTSWGLGQTQAEKEGPVKIRASPRPFRWAGRPAAEPAAAPKPKGGLFPPGGNVHVGRRRITHIGICQKRRAGLLGTVSARSGTGRSRRRWGPGPGRQTRCRKFHQATAPDLSRGRERCEVRVPAERRTPSHHGNRY